MKIDLSVVAPAFNEADNLNELVQRTHQVFQKRKINGEIIIVNDGSSDHTRQVLSALSLRYPNLKPIHHEKNRGIEGGWKSGVEAAQGTYVCLIDSDLQNLPEDIYRLYRQILSSPYSMVQGYRSSVGRLKDSRYILSKGLLYILNLMFGVRLRDTKSGFVIARREVLKATLNHRLHYYFFQTFIAISAVAKGYRVGEVETLFENRLLGKSFLPRFPVRAVVLSFVDIAKAFWEFRLFPKRENTLGVFLNQNPPRKSDRPLLGWRRAWLETFFLTMPLHKWMITRRARKFYFQLKRSQYLSPEQIQEFQEVRLRQLMDHVYHHVPYYRDRMKDLGIQPTDISTISDLSKLPFLTKQDVRENLYFDLLSDTHDKRNMLKVTTSGSTGEPFVCFSDREQLEMRWASTQRSLEWTGYRFGDRTARLWHQTIGMSWVQIAKERLDAWFNRRLFIPAFEMTEQNIEKFIQKLRRHRPMILDGYAESFNFLAHFLKQQDLSGLQVKGVMSSAQILPDQSRNIISDRFQCKVYDKYGSREFSGIAYECGEGDGHHIVAESYIVEILKDGAPAKPGEIGEVVITDLNNYCMPLIRYRIGDLATAVAPGHQCACGRGLPKVGKIEGRIQAIIIGTNGSYVPGTFFAHLFKDYDHVVRQYQVVQEELGSIALKIIKAPRFTEVAFHGILDLLKQYLGRDMEIRVEFVESIPLGRTGKHHGSISKLEISFQELKQSA